MIWGKVISFTDRGADVGYRISASMPDDCIELYARGVESSLRSTSLSRMVQQAMVDCGLLIFVGASGIAVRTIAPYLRGKAYDPAVLVVDENARFVISLVSGHLGGANALAQRLASNLGAQPVITTATDGRKIFAVDTWAKGQRCEILEVDHIRNVSAALLRGEQIGMRCKYPVLGNVPSYISAAGDQTVGFCISTNADDGIFEKTLHLVPRIIHLGIGCRRGVLVEVISSAVQDALKEAKVHPASICAVASIDVKKDEVGLSEFCIRHALPFYTFSAKELLQVAGEFTASAFVRQTVGVDNVCERAALKSAGGKLIYRKKAKNGVTIALAEENWRVKF